MGREIISTGVSVQSVAKTYSYKTMIKQPLICLKEAGIYSRTYRPPTQSHCIPISRAYIFSSQTGVLSWERI